LECASLAEQREHFGFGDGFGQPAIEGSGVEHLPGQGFPQLGGRWRPLNAGEFILGYPDEDSGRPEIPVAPFGVNGSYMVLRKLEQNVPLFRTFLAEAAAAHGLTPERVAAGLVGRWPDGTPLALAPDGPDPAISNVKKRINDFRYHDDPDGRRCPIGAHIRRTNPRDALDPQGRLTLRHRMIRRGMPYGAPLPPGKVDTASRGLAFVCYVASIERQFEDVQREWCNDGDGLRLGLDRDFICGRPRRPHEPPNKLLLAGRKPILLEQPRAPFVTNKGGDYFFAPGVTALLALAGGAW
jgi:Dyp-type peroxidase family